MLTLQVDIRNAGENLEKLRKAGKIPAVFYGKKEASTPISLNQTDFLKVWQEAGESTVVTLLTPQGEKESLIHDIDFDPITGTPRHADFYVFEKGHKVEIDVPIEFTGTSPAVKDLGGSLIKVLHELKIEALPKDLPREIMVDISSLANFGDQITAKEITLPTGVSLLENEEEVIVLVTAPREEKEEETAPIDLESIEVEKKGKEEVPEGEATEEAGGKTEEKSE